MKPADLAAFFGLLHRYYSHGLTRVHPSEWHAFEVFAQEPLARENSGVRDAISRIAQASEGDIESFEFEFNRLFVGPEELKAAPYETVYLSGERVLMRQSTMSVRRAYEEAGMQVSAKNIEPDDHAAYECAFMGWLAGQEGEEAGEAFASFAKEHLNRWVSQHVAAVRENTVNEVCLGFADLFESVTALSLEAA